MTAATRERVTGGDASLSRRPALDGLRGVAVLAVVAYHLGLFLGGGFLGVDIFFVLSGFLIGSLLDGELSRTGRIDLPRFWARRARRLLPALVIVGVAVAIWVHQTGDWETWPLRRDDLLATFAYIANWHFVLADTDYFAATSGASPLLHTWSLAVEEQFYVLWPLVFLGATWLGMRLVGRRRLREGQGSGALRGAGASRARLVPIVVAALVATTSVALLAVLFDPAAPSRAYYGTDTRIHQILVGVLLAFLVRPWAADQRIPPRTVSYPERSTEGDPAIERRMPRAPGSPRGWSVASIVQVPLAIVLGVALVVAEPTNPIYYMGGSFLVALVVAGVILAVERAPRGPLARILSSRVLVAFGTISYGLYLWHWPIIVATAPADATVDTLSLLPLRLTLSIGLAAIMFVVVERPIREGRLPVIRRGSWRTLAAAAVALAVAMNISVAATDLGGASILSGSDSSSVSASTDDSLPTTGPSPSSGRSASPGAAGTRRATPSPSAPATPAPSIDVAHTEAEIAAAMADFEHWQCPTNDQICTKVQGPPGALTVVTFGDSSIGSMDVGMSEWAQRVGATYILAASGGCSASGEPRSDNPTQVKKGAMDPKCEDRYSTIVDQVAALPTPLVVLVSDVSENRSIVLPDGSVAPFGTSAQRQAVESGLNAFVRRLDRSGVTVVLMAPAAHTLKPKCSVPTSSGDCALAPLASDWSAQATVGTMFADVAARFPWRVKLIQLGDIVCPGGGPCSSWQGNLLLRWDGIHYTRPGSRLIVAAVVRRLKTAGIALPG